MEFLLFFVVVIGVVFWYVNHRKPSSDLVNQPERRTSNGPTSNREFAAQHGWNYRPDEPTYVDRWSGDPFGKGEDRRASNVVDGVHEGYPVTLFDYQYTTRSGQSGSRIHGYTVWVVRLPAEVPYVELSPWGVARSMFGDWAGMQDVKVGPPPFDEQFRIVTDDETFVQKWLGYPVTKLMVNTGPYTIWTQGADLICVDQSRTGKESMLEILYRMAERLPT